MEIIPMQTRIDQEDCQDGVLLFKREDLNPSGSFKDRLVYQIWTELVREGEEREIVLSSSGNLAISVLFYAVQMEQKPKHGIKIFIRDNLPLEKQARLDELVARSGQKLVVSKRPKSDCAKYARATGAFWLRNSAGVEYPKAYHSLAAEIEEYSQSELDAGRKAVDGVVVCVSSGTAAQGLSEALPEEMKIVLVQTSQIQPLLPKEDGAPVEHDSSPSLANAISDRVMNRRRILQSKLETRDHLVVACNNEEITSALIELGRLYPGKEFTGNAALSLAGFVKARKKGYSLSKPIIIISGN